MLGLRHATIARKLPLAVIGAAFAACLCVGAGAYLVGDRAVAALTAEKIEAVAQERARELLDYFTAIEDDLLVSAASNNTVTALKGMKMGWDQLVENQGSQLAGFYVAGNPYGPGERQLFDQSESHAAYNRTHGRYHPGFRGQAATRGYSDIFLVDPAGNLLYSVMKDAEYGANILATPEWAETPLARMVTAALALPAGEMVFSDAAPYTGNAGAPASFVATPVFEGRDLSGVLVFELDPAGIQDILATRLGLGTTGETFLVGTDHLFRNDSPFTESNDVLATRYDGMVVAQAFESGALSSGWESSYRGDMLASGVPLSFAGTDWVLVAALSEEEAMASVDRMGVWILAITGTVVVLAAALGLLFTRSITRPITRLTRSMTLLAQGELETEVRGSDRSDELGDMARAVEVFRANASRIQQLTEEEHHSAERHRDEHAAMMRELQRGFGEVVDAAVVGDFSHRVPERFDDPELNSLARSINNLVETVERGLGQSVAVLGGLAQADLTGRVHGDFQGAFGQLRDGLNKVGETLATTLVGLRHTSRSLKIATGEILSGANDLSDRTTQQSATIEETSSAIEQLSTTVAENARRAAEASLKAQAVSVTATEGGAVMRRANDAMERIIASSGKIANIIRLIDDIAFQTNLLALNASVEAARAGEAGRGFAVVAVEVRRLAQSAAKASSEVKTLIEESGADVEGGSKLVAEASEKLLVMLEAAKESSTLIEDIAKASQEQATGIEGVSSAIRILDSMTQHNAALVEETNASLEQAEAQAIELDRIVDGFILERDDNAAARAA